jgi:hypothetical protein
MARIFGAIVGKGNVRSLSHQKRRDKDGWAVVYFIGKRYATALGGVGDRDWSALASSP